MVVGGWSNVPLRSSLLLQECRTEDTTRIGHWTKDQSRRLKSAREKFVLVQAPKSVIPSISRFLFQL